MIFRFGNGIFEPIWNRRYIDHVQITASETVGVERRGGYYETAGALRDMVPNHLFQLVSLTAMEPPISFHADAVRDEQAKALHAIQIPVARRSAYHGRARPIRRRAHRRRTSRGLPLRANVAPDSTTETFAGLKLRIDNWRWADVPFYLRTGKRLAKRTTEIAIQFKRAPFQLFRDTPVENLETNRLVLYIQPEEGLSLRFGAKIPGPIMHMGGVEMKFNYVDYFGRTPAPATSG
jgi:glucose-6-phosphate 1-dehydrogenase